MFGEHALGVKAIGSQGTLQVGTSSFAGVSLQVSVAVGVLEATQSKKVRLLQLLPLHKTQLRYILELEVQA